MKLHLESGIVKPGLLALAAVLAISPRAAAETTVTGEIDAGYQTRHVSANESKFEEYGEVTDGAVIPHVKIQSTDEHSQTTFEGHNLKQNDQSYNLEYNRNYKLDIDASWDQIPHDYSNIGATLYNQVAPGVLVLPSGLKRAFSQTTNPSASNFNSTYSSFTALAHNAALQTLDNRGAVNLKFSAGEHMKYNLGISEDRIEGAKPQSFALGSSFPIQMPVPVDWKVYNMHAGSEYASKDAQVGVKYQMSAFKNNIDTLIWDSPKRLTDVNGNAAQGQTALPPDNWSQTVTLSGGVNLPAKTRFTAKGSMGYMNQNQNLLPITDNSALGFTPVGGASTKANLLSILPEASANAKMLTWMQDYALTNRLVRDVTFGAHYHSYQLVNRTAEVNFPGRSSWDATFSTGPFSNDRFEFRKDTVEGSADWQVIRPLALGIRYATEWDHRTDREITDTTEKILTVTTDIKPANNALLRGSFVHAHRRPQDFNGAGIFEESAEGGPTTYEELPGLRRYDTSDRLRNQGRVIAQWDPGVVSFSLNGSLTHDNYQPGMGDLLAGTTNNASMYGLMETRDATAGGDIMLDVSERLSFDMYYQYEETKGLQRSNKAGTSAAKLQMSIYDWSVWSTDRYHLAGITANIGKPTDRVGVKLGYDVVISRGSNDFVNVGSAVTPATVTGLTLTPGVLVSPTDTKYMKQDITMKTNVRVTEKVGVMFGYTYEKYDVSNWQEQNLPLVGGTPAGQTNIFLGTNLQNYVAHIVSVLVKYKF